MRTRYFVGVLTCRRQNVHVFWPNNWMWTSRPLARYRRTFTALSSPGCRIGWPDVLYSGRRGRGWAHVTVWKSAAVKGEFPFSVTFSSRDTCDRTIPVNGNDPAVYPLVFGVPAYHRDRSTANIHNVTHAERNINTFVRVCWHAGCGYGRIEIENGKRARPRPDKQITIILLLKIYENPNNRLVFFGQVRAQQDRPVRQWTEWRRVLSSCTTYCILKGVKVRAFLSRVIRRCTCASMCVCYTHAYLLFLNVCV